MYKNAKKWHCNGAIIFYLQTPCNFFAVVASKKIGNAVVRNRCKRQLRSIFRQCGNLAKQGCYVLIVKQEIKEINFNKLEKNIKWGLSKLQCLRQS